MAFLGAMATFTVMTACAEPPSLAAFGYFRQILPGIPAAPGPAAGNQRPGLPPEYFLYVEVAPGGRASVDWAAIRGEYYSASLRRVNTPVLIDEDAAVPTGKKETLVPNSRNDVYQVVLGDKRAGNPRDEKAAALVRRNDFAARITTDDTHAYAVVKTLTALRPKAGM